MSMIWQGRRLEVKLVRMDRKLEKFLPGLVLAIGSYVFGLTVKALWIALRWYR